jgi:hypothetical protein
MTDQELLNFNSQGFIPGPKESEEEFKSRIDAAKRIFSEHATLPKAHWEWVRLHLKELFHFEPESIAAYYSNQKLAPWQGAACWIGEDKVPLLQLRNGFRKGAYLKLYTRGEILAHESVHAARAAFDDPQNEEFFAYATAAHKWRRVLGPIFQRVWEPWLLFASLALGLVWEAGWLMATALIGMGFWRLIRRFSCLSKAFNHLMGRLKDAKTARAVLFRLSDKEIKMLSQGKWIEGDKTLRWRLIRLAYLK